MEVAIIVSKILIKNAKKVITCDDTEQILSNVSILIDGPKIVQIAANIDIVDAEVIDASNMFVYPGLINTHHHLLQVFTRNIPEIQTMELFDWLMYLYEIWRKVDSEFAFYSSLIGMGELLKYGCTTCFDQHFAFPKGKGKDIIDRQMDAAEMLGVRFHAGRSSFTRGRKDGGLPPDDLVETTSEILSDCERVIDKYHDAQEFSMRQIVVAPCSPFSVDDEIMIESAKLARSKGVRLHTHLTETLDEERYTIEKYGKRPLAWAHDLGWTGSDVWYAHGIHFNSEEIDLLSETQTGVAHCPVSNQKLSSGIARIPEMLKKNVPVGLGVDGCGSNDGSNLMAEIRASYLLHRLNSSKEAPSGYDILKIATSGGARILGRSDIGSIEVGKGADLFLIDVDRFELVGATEDPGSFLAVVGLNRPVDYTIVNGKVVVKEGRLINIDEDVQKREAQKYFRQLYDQ